MKNNKLNSLLKKAEKINQDKIAKADFTAPILENEKIKNRDFKLYYSLIETRNEGWGLIDIIGVALFSFSALIAIIGSNENPFFLYFQIVSIGGAVFFITKVFLITPIIHSIKYFAFKSWIKNSKIKITGWEKAYNNDDLLKATNWYQQCSVLIKLDANCSSSTKTLVDAAIVVSVENASWVQNLFDGSMVTWELSDNKLAGSANSSVLGNIQRFIHNDLSAIHNKYGGIVSVEIKSDEQMIHVMKLDSYSSGM